MPPSDFAPSTASELAGVEASYMQTLLLRYICICLPDLPKVLALPIRKEATLATTKRSRKHRHLQAGIPYSVFTAINAPEFPVSRFCLSSARKMDMYH